jgi:hypothetical protein
MLTLPRAAAARVSRITSMISDEPGLLKSLMS